MNKEFNIYNINQIYGFVGARFETSDFFQVKIYKAGSLMGLAFLFGGNTWEHSTPNFHSDYIENKTTSGGLIKIKSITQNSFIESLIKFMQRLLSDIRPHVIFDKAANLNGTLILERLA